MKRGSQLLGEQVVESGADLSGHPLVRLLVRRFDKVTLDRLIGGVESTDGGAAESGRAGDPA